jgi:uncharacterized repeat protein (TIGR02543 family)
VDVKPSGGGMIKMEETVPSAYPDIIALPSGINIRLEAVPASGYQFDGWSDDLSGTTNPITIMMDCNRKVTANFSQIKPNWWLPGSIIAGVIIIGMLAWLTVKRRIA